MYKKKECTITKILLAKPKLLIQTKTAFEFFESEHLLLTLNCDPYAIGKDHIFERLNPLKKNCHSGLRRFILDSGKKKNKNKCRSLNAIKNIAWNSPSKLNLFPLVKARFSGKWFVLCSLKYRVNYAETRHWFVELSNTIIERTAILFLQCGRFVCVGLSWKHERKKKITISKKNTLKESLQEDCCGNRFCVKECHSCTLRERKTSVSFRSFHLIGGTKTLKSIKFVYWL